MIAAGATCFIGSEDSSDINFFQHCIDGANRMISGYQIIDIERKKRSLMLMILLKNNLKCFSFWHEKSYQKNQRCIAENHPIIYTVKLCIKRLKKLKIKKRLPRTFETASNK